MRLLYTLISLFLVLGATGCAVDPEWVSSSYSAPITFSGTNGFVINGGSYSNAVVNCDSAVGSLIQVFGTYQMTSVTLFGHLNNDPISCELTLVTGLDAAPGTFIWSNGTGTDHVSVGISGFNMVSGETVISKFGEPGEAIEGTFRGTMKSKSAPSEYVQVNGKFSAIRRE